MDELARRVDGGFVEQLGAQPGFVSYEFLDCGDGDVLIDCIPPQRDS